MRVRFSVGLLVITLCLSAPSAQAQSTPGTTQSNAQAIALATSAFTALANGVQVNDVTLTGTATRTLGSDIESGTVTLEALGTAYSSMNFVTAGGTRSEIRNLDANGNPQGFWAGLDVAFQSMANHNCFTDAAWFFPVLTVLSQASSPNIVATYIGQETRGNAIVQHLRFSSQFSVATGPINAVLTSLTTEDIYLDSGSLLPVAILFNVHPDSDAGTNIPVEADFSSYKLVSGVQIPFHIQKFFNGSLLLDMTIQLATLNSGLTGSTFSPN